ncbi:MAG: amidohydrolase family protein [Gammaproteobacteria bacterium]|nr:amidohydrolase family protein [Gammaproteobacteria bacterium]
MKAGAGRGRRGLALRDSPRTLQRRLTEEGFTFKRPVSEVRFLSARRLIVENHKLSEIATRLGYADASSFTGAFERWTGISPQRYRSQYGRTASAPHDKPKYWREMARTCQGFYVESLFKYHQFGIDKMISETLFRAAADIVKRIAGIPVAILLAAALAQQAMAADKEQPRQVLFTNVHVFDGISAERLENANVLVEGNLIKQVSTSPIEVDSIYTVDGGGRTLMPGLIDMHSHLCFRNGMLEFRDGYDQMAAGAYTAFAMRDYLDQGFTTVRDAGCNVLGVAKAVKNGIVPGPRIYPSGAFLSQTGGHGDTGNFNDQPGDQDKLEAAMVSFIVDGVGEVMKAARHNLRAGATQIKIMAGGGVASEFDPLHMTQFSLEEMNAIVGVAEDYGTYVLAHAYHDLSVNRAIDAGVKVIEHNFLVSEKTIKRMAKEGVALSVQSIVAFEVFNPKAVEQVTFFSADQKAKAVKVNSGAKQMLEWAVKHDLLMVTGGDMFGPDLFRQAENIISFNNEILNNPHHALKTATSNAATVVGFSGEMNPYKEGTLGTIVEGGYADIILVDGNPLEDINVIKRDSVDFVMKDGLVYKNWLPDEDAPAFLPAGPERDEYFGNL